MTRDVSEAAGVPETVRSGTSSDVVLDVQSLSVTLHNGRDYVPVVEDVSLTVRKGTTHGLVGESGSGKSVTALSILGLLPKTHHPAQLDGQILLDDVDLLQISQRQMRRVRGQRIAMIFQQPADALNPTVTIGRQLAEVVRVREGVSRAAAKRRSVELLGHVGISNPDRRLHDFPHQFSGGMLQRVMIAMALIGTPQLLIADEPTTALDTTVQAQILELLNRLQQEMHLSILFITHNLGVVAAMCDEVSVMYAGQIVEHRRASPLFDRPEHPYLAALLNATPEASVEGGQLVGISGRVPPPGRRPASCRFAPRCQYAIDACTLGAIPLMDAANGQVRCIRAPAFERERINR